MIAFTFSGKALRRKVYDIFACDFQFVKTISQLFLLSPAEPYDTLGSKKNNLNLFPVLVRIL